MQLKITIMSSFASPEIKEGTRDDTRELLFDVPEHLLEHFTTAFGHAVKRLVQASTIDGLTVTIPYRMSWDPVFKLKDWFTGWLQEEYSD